MRIQNLIVVLYLLLTACGGGGSSSGKGGDLGQCEFSINSNYVPVVEVSVYTEDQSIEKEIRNVCEKSRSEIAQLKSCGVKATNAMLPVVIRTEDKGYVLVNETANGSGTISTSNTVGSATQVPSAVGDSVIFEWMVTNGIQSFGGCG